MHYNKCIIWYKLGHHGDHSNQNPLWMYFVLSEWSIIIKSNLMNKNSIRCENNLFVYNRFHEKFNGHHFYFKWTYIRTYQTEQTTLEWLKIQTGLVRTNRPLVWFRFHTAARHIRMCTHICHLNLHLAKRWNVTFLSFFPFFKRLLCRLGVLFCADFPELSVCQLSSP